MIVFLLPSGDGEWNNSSLLQTKLIGIVHVWNKNVGYTIYFRGIFRSPPAAKRKSAQYPSNYELAPIWPPLKCNFSWLLPSKSIFDPFQWPGEVRRYQDPVISYGRCCTQNHSSHGTPPPQPRPKHCSRSKRKMSVLLQSQISMHFDWLDQDRTPMTPV